MVIAEEILEHLKKIPESAQAEVLDFVGFLEQSIAAKAKSTSGLSFP